MAIVPVTAIEPGEVTWSSTPASRIGAAIATVRPATSVVSGMTTRWSVPAKRAVPPSTRWRRPSPSMTSTLTVTPAQSSGTGLGSGESGAVTSALSSVIARRMGRPGMATAAEVGRAAVSSARVAGVAWPRSSGGNVRIRDAPSGLTETSAPFVTTRPTSIDSRTLLVRSVTPSTDEMAGPTAQPGVDG